MKDKKHFIEGGPIWPTETQMLMLRILLGDDGDARDAWPRWVDRVNIMELDDGAYRLVPMLYNRLRYLDIEHPLRDRMKRIYRHAAYRNRLLFHRASQVVEMLGGNGIDVMLLKGAVLAEQYYEDCADRPMRDVDILVRRKDAVRAMALFAKSQDWQPANPYPLKDLDALRHAQGYTSRQGVNLDLHWTLLPEMGYHPGAMDGLWQRSQPIQFHDQSVRSLSPEDQLFHLCAHGLRWNTGSCLRWSVDAMKLIRSVPIVDWDALLTTAEAYRYQLLMREALGFLAHRLGAPVPDEVLLQLEKARLPPHADRQFARSSSPRSLLGVLPAFWASYRLHTDGRRDTPGLPPFSRCLLSTLGIDHYRQLPSLVAHNSWNRLTDWANPRTGFGRSNEGNPPMVAKKDPPGTP